MPLTIANRITIVRILAIPFFIMLLMYYSKGAVLGQQHPILRWSAFGIFLSIFLLDAVDGYIARSRGEITHLGTILDPLADKLVLVSALLLLSIPPYASAFQPHLPFWFIAVIISRDIILSLGALLIQNIVGSLTVRPRVTGKIATFFQGTIIVWVLIGLPDVPFFWLIGIAALFIVVSASQYIFDGIRQLEKAK